MKNNKYNEYKPIEDGELLGGFKGEVFCFYKGKEYNIEEYQDLYEKLKEICKIYFDKKDK